MSSAFQIPRFDKAMSANGIAYYRVGRGPVLLLIHGVGLRAESWYPLVKELAKHFDVIAIDLPGHGNSKALANSFESADFEHYYVAIKQFIESMSISSYFICGHSLGALLSVTLAAREASKARGLLALNTVFQRSEAATHAVQERAYSLAKSDTVIGVTQTVERWFGANPSADMLVHAHACEQWLRANSVEGYSKAYKVFADQRGPSYESLQKIDCKSIFMTGELDINSSPSMSRALSEASQGSIAEEVSGAGHMMPLTHSQYVINALMTLNQYRAKKTIADVAI